MNAIEPSSNEQQGNLGYLIFTLDGTHYALPAPAVGEVVEKQPVTPIPFMPEHVDGVVNIGGRAIPQLDLRRYLGGNDLAAAGDYELLLVDSDDVPFVLAVDRVLARHEVPVADVRQTLDHAEGTDGEAARRSLMQCEFTWEGKTVIGLDPARFIHLFTTVAVETGRAGVLGREAARVQKDAQSTQKFIIVRDGAEHYGLQVAQVLEIVDMKQFTKVPSAPGEVVGIGMLRKDPVLVLSLRALLGVEGRGQDSGTVLIVAREEARYGLIVDELEGILELSEENIHRTADGNGLAGVLIDESGQLDGWLDVDGLINADHMRVLRSFTPVVQVTESSNHDTYRQVLQISIGGEKFAVALNTVRRVMEFTPPEPVRDSTRPWLIGVMDIDGEVVAVTDLAEDLGQPRRTVDGSLVVVGDDHCEWALVVQQVDRILDIPEDSIESIPESDGGYVNAVAVCDGALISILDLGPMFESVTRAMEART